MAACFQKRGGIVLPRCFIKIGGQEETGLIQKHRINAHDESLTKVVLTAEMPANHLFSDGKKALVWAFGTLNSRFIADSLGPLIGTSGRIAGPTCLAAFEAARVNILSSPKQRTEQGDFGLGG